MRAVLRETYGAGMRLDRREIEQPQIAPNEVLVRVRAAGVDRSVVQQITGRPWIVRTSGYGLRRPKIPVPGRDLAGVVERVGAAVRLLEPGQDVFGVGVGAFAEFARASASELAIKPNRLSYSEAAALATSGSTALQGLRDHARLRSGQRVLIMGASGGVGTLAVQIAKAIGAEVTGVCSTGKVDLVRSLGADHAIDYSIQHLDARDRRYDVILDNGGTRRVSDLRRMLTSKGVLVIVGGEARPPWLGDMQRQWRAIALSRFVSQDLKTITCRINYPDLVALAAMADAGQLRPVVERTFPLSQTVYALHHLNAGRARGKVVIRVADDDDQAPGSVPPTAHGTRDLEGGC